jgi:hypothetical protein
MDRLLQEKDSLRVELAKELLKPGAPVTAGDIARAHKQRSINLRPPAGWRPPTKEERETAAAAAREKEAHNATYRKNTGQDPPGGA